MKIQFDAAEAAVQLVDAAWYRYGVDPSVLLSLVIPASDLERDTSFGVGLLKLVGEVLGKGNVSRHLASVVCEIQKIFQGRQGRGESPCSGMKGLNLSGEYDDACAGGVTVVWEGTRKSDVLVKMEKRQKRDTGMVSMVQFVRHDGKRFFRAYENPQDMVSGMGKLLMAAKSPYMYIAETPVSRQGVLKLYFDTEYYLKKMNFLDTLGGTREEKIKVLVEIADKLPGVLSTILVSTNVIDGADTRRVIVKDNSREIENGDFKVARHLIFDILLTSTTRDEVMDRIFSWIRGRFPVLLGKIHNTSNGGGLSKHEYDRICDKRMVSLVGIDPASKSSMQMLRFAWTRKTDDQPLLTLHKIVKVRNGAVVSEDLSPMPAYTGNDVKPAVDEWHASAALWDSCISVPSPMCRPVKEIVLSNKRKALLEEDQDGSSSKKRSRLGKYINWSDIKCSWFVSFCKKICKGGDLPRLNTSVPYAGVPEEFEDGMVFQVNASNINVCAMSLMQIPVSKKAHVHKSNGTIFCVHDDAVLVRCLDPACVSRLAMLGNRWKDMSKEMMMVGSLLPCDNRIMGKSRNAWWAKLTEEFVSKLRFDVR